MVEREEGEIFFSKLLGQKLVTVIDDGSCICNYCAYYDMCGIYQTIERIRMKYETGSCCESYSGIHFETKQVIYEIPRDLLEIIKEVESDDYMTDNTKETLILLLIESEYNKHK